MNQFMSFGRYCLIAEMAIFSVMAQGQKAAAQAIAPNTENRSGAGIAGGLQVPAGPMLRPVAPYSEWVITYSYPEDRAAKGGKKPETASQQRTSKPRKTLTTKTDCNIRVHTVDVAGRTEERWFVGSVQYIKPAGSGAWYWCAGGNPGSNLYYSPPLPASGFADMDWINEKAYVGTARVGNTDCMVFVPGGLDPASAGNPARQAAQLAAEPKVAYVNAETRLPVALRILGEIRQFTFNNPPTALLCLPPDLAAQIKRGEEARQRLEQPAARPY